MEALVLELKNRIIEALNLEDITPEEIDENAPLFGTGLGLDSIDALELIVLLDKYYGIRLDDPKKRKRNLSISNFYSSIYHSSSH